MADDEIPMSIEEARRHPLAVRGGGEPVPFGTFIRWIYTGCGSVKLETEMRGGRRVVFKSALERFNQARSNKPIGNANRPPAKATRVARITQALSRKRPKRELQTGAQ